MQYHNPTLSMPAGNRLVAKPQKTGDVIGLLELKKMAKSCLLAQFGASFIYFFSSLFFPDSHSLAVTCGVLAILVSLTPVFYAVSNKRFILLFSCLTAINLSPIWFLYLEAVIPGYDAYVYSQPVYRMEAFFWVAVFMIFVNGFYLLFWKRGTNFSVKSFSFLRTIKFKPAFFARLTILAFAIPLIGFYLYYGSAEKLWIYLTAGRSERGIELIMESVGGMGALLNPLTWVLQLTPMFGAIAFVSYKKRYQLLPIVSIVLSVLVIFVFFLSGSRGTMMFVAAPVLFFLFYYNWQRGLKFWIPAAISLFMLIGVMELQVRFRGNLLDVIVNPEKAAKENDLKSITTFDPSKSHRDNNTYLLCLLVKGYPDKYAYEGFNDFFATLVNPIPRAIWPNKPLMNGAKDLFYQPQWVLDGPLFMGTTSLSFSVVGEGYLANGLWGLLIYGSVYGLFLIFFDGIIYYTREKQPLPAGMLGVGVFLAFWGFRSFFALTTFLYPIMLFILAMSVARKLKGVF
ncbi:MAG: O-antigen ligase family protein [Sphingobacteriaceae bacterium]|nr:O-antigen ligase family protein [Sphingobacteriaceae bacterium]